MNTSPEHHPGFLLYDSARLFRRCFGTQLEDLGISEPQWRLISAINRFAGMNQSQLAALLGIGKAPLGKLVDRLETEKLLSRASDPVDRRQKQLQLTERGSQLAGQILERYTQLRPKLIHGLTEALIGEFENALRLIYQQLVSLDTRPARLPVEQLTLMALVGGISRRHGRNFEQQLKQLGVSRAQWLVMISIARNEGIQQQELARHLQMHKVALGQLVDELEDAGRVQRKVDPEDRRARLLFLTDVSKRGIDGLARSFEKLHEQSLQGISAGKRQKLAHTLRTLHSNLKSIVRQQKEPDLETSHEH